MSQSRPLTANKGQYRCFGCRVSMRSKEGSWHAFENQQVFFCWDCGKTPPSTRPKAMLSGLKL